MRKPFKPISTERRDCEKEMKKYFTSIGVSQNSKSPNIGSSSNPTPVNPPSVPNLSCCDVEFDLDNLLADPGLRKDMSEYSVNDREKVRQGIVPPQRGKPASAPVSQQLSSHNAQLWGWSFTVFGVVFFVGFFYAAVVSKLLPPSDNPILSAIQEDRYYCFLIPLSLPVLVVFIYFHWLSMKLFKHA